MNITDIITLANAGFTAEQITKLSEASPEGKTEKPEPAKTEPTQQTAGNTSNDALVELLTGLGSKFDKLSEQLAKSALRASEQPPEPSADDFIASIINPYMKKEDKQNA